MELHSRKAPDIDLSPVADGFIIHRAERDRLHYLNHTAVLILELCNGRHSVSEIAELIQGAYALPHTPRAEVDELIATMEDEGLLEPYAPAEPGLERRSAR